ncbi:MAG: DUF2344 domain-containing protein [Ruminococcaceae bacterium]|nr:DUF2344 domain-containing protein [Oscillospiraceae bacterium]
MKLLRIFFTKTGEAAYISHLDLQRVMARALRISGLPVWYSQGFNPHIYMSFALPLPLMMESVAESVDVKTESELEDFSAFVAPLNTALPRGIEASAIAAPVHDTGSITAAIYRYCYPDTKDVLTILKRYGQLQEALVVRKTKRSEEEIDLKAVVPQIAISPEGNTCFEVRLPAGNKLHYSPALLTSFIERAFGASAQQARVTRVQVLTKDGEPFC